MKKLFIICAFLFTLVCTGTLQTIIEAVKKPPVEKFQIHTAPDEQCAQNNASGKKPFSSDLIQITISLTGSPNSTTKLVPTDLKYDKWGHLNQTHDDRGNGAPDASIVCDGGTAGNSVTYSPITYTDGANVREQDHPYTFSVASNSWVNTDTADWHFAAPFYMDWPAMKTMVDRGWSILDHGAFHGVDQPGAVSLGFDPMKNAFANRNYIFRKLKEQGVEYVTRFGVVPSADSGYHSAWEQMGYLGGTSENAFDNYSAHPAAEYVDTGLANVTNFKNDDSYKVQARNFKDLTGSDAVAYYKIFFDALIHQSTATTKMSLDFGIHAFQIDTFKTIMDYLHSIANDHIWVCGLQEFYEYFQCIQQTKITQSISGTTMTVTLDQRFLPSDMRWRDMSFKLSSNVGISSVTVTGADDYSYNTSTGLINIYKKKTTGFNLPPYYDATGFVSGKIPLQPDDIFIDNNFGDYRDSSLHINVSKDMLVDGNTIYQYHARLFDGAMIYSPYVVTIDLTDYGPTIDSIRVFRSGISGFTTYVILVRNDTDVPDTIGSFSSGSGWIKFNGPILSKRYVAARLLLSSTSTAGFGNEVEVYANNYQPYTEQVYPHRHAPLKQMLGVNTYVWDFMTTGLQVADAGKMAAFNSLGLTSARFYIDSTFYSQDAGATWSFNPIKINYYEEDAFRRIKQDNPGIVLWNVLQGQTNQIKQSWRDNPNNTYQIKGVVTAYTDHTGYGTLDLSVFFTAGAGGGPANWRIESINRPTAPKQYPEGTPVTIPTSTPSPVTFFIGAGLASSYQVGDTVWARMVEVSQLPIMYPNNTIAARGTLTAWDSLARLGYVYSARRGSNIFANSFLPYTNAGQPWLNNSDSVGLNVANWIEPMNEPNASWIGFNDYVNGHDLAYAWSEFYDHNKVFSTTLGAKNADPNMLVSSSGLAVNVVDLNRGAEIVSRMLRGNRPKEDVPMQPNYWKAQTWGWTDNPFDIIQYHNYPFTGGADQYASGINGGLPIELSPSIASIDADVWYRNKYAPSAIVDIGEWGYDIHSGSPINAVAIGSHSIEQVRGAWSVRFMLEANVHGVDRAQWYRLYSYDSTGTQFSTMSLLMYNPTLGTFSRRLVGNYFAQFATIGDYWYDATLRNDSIRVHRFTNGTNYIYAIWAVENWTNQSQVFYQKPTFTERTGTYTLPLANGTLVTVMNFQDNGTVMSTTSDAAGSGGYPVSYSLKPVFIQTAVPPGRFTFYYKGGLKYVHH
jgi:hypothetical protein